MIVEDSLLQATSIEILLKRYEISKIYTVSNGEEAINMCQIHDFDLAFCDLKIPQIDGVSLLASPQAVRSIKRVVILSAMPHSVLESTQNMCVLIGYQNVEIICKPIRDSHIKRLFSSYALSKTVIEIQSAPVVLNNKQVQLAFENNWFVNAYQSQHNVNEAKVVGVELLARIMHPEFGLIAPSHFMEAIRRLNLLDQLFYTVLEQGLKDISILQEPLSFSINIEQSTLRIDVADKIIRLCNRYNISPSLLTLEITEHETFLLDANCYKNIAKLSMYGIGLSIDDFGTGYASLSQLSNLPFTELKVDRSFVYNISTNKKHQVLTKACINLAKNLGLSCIIEGVEQQQDYDYLSSIGMTKYQGYFTSKPASFSELVSQNDLK
nr:EAL domain-containing response regulator [Vibrio splendidus]